MVAIQHGVSKEEPHKSSNIGQNRQECVQFGALCDLNCGVKHDLHSTVWVGRYFSENRIMNNLYRVSQKRESFGMQIPLLSLKSDWAVKTRLFWGAKHIHAQLYLAILCTAPITKSVDQSNSCFG